MSEPSFQVAASVLSRALKVASRVVERRNTLPILAHVLLEVAEGSLTLTASDLDVQFEQKLKVDQDAPFSAALPADKLTQFIGALSGDVFCKFSTDDDGRVIIRAGRSRITLPVLPAGDFPKLGDFDNAGLLEVSAASLSRMLNRVLPFVSKDDPRFCIEGPLWHGEEGQLALAATDTVVALRDIEASVAWPENAPEVILAPKACRVATAMLEGADRALIGWSERLSRFTVSGAVLTAKVIDGMFPNYRRIIPEAREDATVVDPEVVIAALSRLRPAADSKDCNFANFEPDGDEAILLSMRSGDATTFAREAIPAQVNGAPGAAVSILPLGAVMDVVGGDSVEISQADSDAAMRIERVVKDGVVAVLNVGRGFRPTVERS
ncbi:MAG: DNA polymerase III subunit beta [Pseudomonadota bacterium]